MPDVIRGASYDLIRTWEDGHHGFRLEVYDTYQLRLGKPLLAYRFSHGDALVFEGDDFGASPLHAADGDETVAGILAFLALKPGDAEDEWFAGYTPEQLDWAREWGDRLARCVEELESGSRGD